MSYFKIFWWSCFSVLSFISLICFSTFYQIRITIQIRIGHHLVDKKYESFKDTATDSLINLCLCNFSGARFFIRFISWSVNLLCCKIFGSVGDSDNINDRSCLISSSNAAKQLCIYWLRIFAIIDSSLHFIKSK